MAGITQAAGIAERTSMRREDGVNTLLTLLRHGHFRSFDLACKRETPMEAAKPLPQAKSLPPTFDKLIKELPGLINQELPVSKQSNASANGDDIVASGDTSIGEIEKLMEELRVARDYLKAEGERIRRANARYAHLTSTASASVKIIAESMGKWRITEVEAAQ